MPQISSQISSVSSDDYSVILPDCFDTSRPLGESMYSSAMSQPGTGAAALASDKSDVEQEEEEESIMEPGRDALLGERQELTEVASAEDLLGNAGPPLVTQINSSVNQMPCASQTVDEVTLTPEVVPFPDPLLPPPTLYSPRLDGGHIWMIDDMKAKCYYFFPARIFPNAQTSLIFFKNKSFCIISGLRHFTWLTIPVLQPVTQMSRINQESTSMVSITATARCNYIRYK